MTGLNHVFRRGAVYVWRRRVPSRAGSPGRFVQVSLGTTEFSTAKARKCLADSVFQSFWTSMESGRITPAEARMFIAHSLAEEIRRLEDARYEEAPAQSPGEWRERYLIERCRSVAARLVAGRGRAAAGLVEGACER